MPLLWNSAPDFKLNLVYFVYFTNLVFVLFHISIAFFWQVCYHPTHQCLEAYFNTTGKVSRTLNFSTLDNTGLQGKILCTQPSSHCTTTYHSILLTLRVAALHYSRKSRTSTPCSLCNVIQINLNKKWVIAFKYVRTLNYKNTKRSYFTPKSSLYYHHNKQFHLQWIPARSNTMLYLIFCTL